MSETVLLARIKNESPTRHGLADLVSDIRITLPPKGEVTIILISGDGIAKTSPYVSVKEFAKGLV